MISLIVLLGTILCLRRRGRHGRACPRKACRLLLGAEMAAVLISGSEFLASGRPVDSLLRPKSGELSREEALIAGTKEGDIPYRLTVEGRKLTGEEEEAKIRAAEEEVKRLLSERTELLPAGEQVGGQTGDKGSLIRKLDRDLSLPQRLQEGLVALHWNLQPEGILEENGRLHRELLAEDRVITASVSYICGSRRKEDKILLLAKAYPKETKEGYRTRLGRELAGQEEKGRESDQLKLPTQDFKGNSIHWRRPYSWRGEKLLLLGLIGAVLMLFAGKRSQLEAGRRQREGADRDYPAIVSELSLYLSAGVTAQNALERMSISYERRRKRAGPVRTGYEALFLLVQRMREGRSEREIYEAWPDLCPTASYRKLSMLLIQNLQRGNRRLAGLLEEEEQRAREAGRLRCKRRGDEASTGLLLPMVGLMAVILVILMAPALFIHL